jgi:hypothetical protein
MPTLIPFSASAVLYPFEGTFPSKATRTWPTVSREQVERAVELCNRIGCLYPSRLRHCAAEFGVKLRCEKPITPSKEHKDHGKSL